MPLPFPVIREIVQTVCPDRLCIPIKEGYTTYVFRETGPGARLVWNVPRDTTAALRDAETGFHGLCKAYQICPAHVAKVEQVVTVKHPQIKADIPVYGVELIDSKELTQCPATGLLGVIEKFNGPLKPDIAWLNQQQSQNILREIARVERETEIEVDVSHGDAVLRPDGKPCIVACSGNRDLHQHIRSVISVPNTRNVVDPSEPVRAQRPKASYPELFRAYELFNEAGRSIIETKCREYALEETDALAHFYRQAQRSGISPLQVVANHLSKQTDAILSYVRRETELSDEQINERIIDARNYLVFLGVIAQLERKDNNVNV